MKKFLVLILSMLMIFTVTGCGGDKKADVKNESEKNKILVAYFSCTGNTKTLAETAAKILNADLYEIKPEIPYTPEDLNYNDETARATVEQRVNPETTRPALADKNANIAQYETVVIAYPIWWHTAPRIICTFLESYDFTNKKIIPISTSGGSDIQGSVDELKNLYKNLDLTDGRNFFKGDDINADLESYFKSMKLK